uniref:Uncharacterized protein n=1 Tax=Helianthus annuus TaxID=4232 RepID=A0A251U432_HELAN
MMFFNGSDCSTFGNLIKLRRFKDSVHVICNDVHISIKRPADVLQTKQNGMIHQDYIILQGLVGGGSSELGYIKIGWVGLLRLIIGTHTVKSCSQR